VCSADQRRCQGAQLQVCNANRTGFVLDEQCASPALCDAEGGSCEPPACAPNQRRCQGATLQVCNANRTGFVTEQQCNNANQCDAEAGVCRGGGGGGGGNDDDDGGNGGGNDDDDDGGGNGGGCTPACIPVLETCIDGECVLLGIIPL
jgi:hypothetical protein